MAAFSTRIRRLADELAALNDELDTAGLDPASLLTIGEAYARTAMLAQAGVTLLAAAVDEMAAYRRTGDRSAADWLAKQTGTNTGAAHKTVNTGRKLQQRPKTAEAMRKGAVSAEQAGIITDADAQDEDALLGVSARRGVKGLREEAARYRQARESEADAMERYRQAHRQRHLRTWTDGARFCFAGSTTLDDGARLLAALEPERQRLFKQAHREGRRESQEAYLLDALVNIATGTSTAKPKAALSLRADMTAVVRGWVELGEKCEIEGVGPIPVTVARWLLGSANAYGELVDGDDVKAITSMTRTIPTKLDRALAARDRTCAVPGCDVSVGLERDHISAFAQGGPTSLDNLCRLCRVHHRLKTLFGWRILGPPGNRQWIPPLQACARR